MTSDSDTDRPDLTEHVVATSEPGNPQETLAELLGVGQHGPDGLTERFLEQDVTACVAEFYEDEATQHALHVDDRVEHVPCVADALIAAVLVDHDPVTVRSFDPVSDIPVVFEVTDDGIEVTPPDHVISIGMAEAVLDAEDMVGATVDALGSGATHGFDVDDLREAGCRYINAFETLDNYERWANDVDAVTVALPAEPLMPGIRRFASGAVFD